MPATQIKTTHSRKQLHESVLEKLHHAISDFAHMVHEIKFKRLMTKAATVITDGLHGKPGKKKVVKKKTAPKGIKTAIPAAKKAVKKAAAVAPKKAAKKIAAKK